MQLPFALLESLKEANGFDKEAFEKVHSSGEQVTSIRLNPLKGLSAAELGETQPGNSLSPVPWSQFGYYLQTRPSFTFDPLFHAGCYYVQEASSMFLEQALIQTKDLSQPIKVLDLCAAPGGKSTHIQSLLSADSLLVSNEVIRSRVNSLKENIIKWGTENVVVTNNDPKDFSRLDNYFDVIVVDAPCSGSGLFRRDPGAIAEWSEANVALCSQRQQRILADCWPSLKEDGILIYSTCSYSEEEDEKICEWLEDQHSMTCVQLSINDDWGIVRSGGGYRFWPDKIKGEGLFMACFQKKESGSRNAPFVNKLPIRLDKNETAVVRQWIETGERYFLKHLNTVYSWPEKLAEDMGLLLEELRVIYSGVHVGELVRDKLVPAHALAMNTAFPGKQAAIEVNKEQAIRYLQKREMNITPGEKGWQLVSFLQHPLGWINALPNRINNYYPKESRILKDN